MTTKVTFSDETVQAVKPDDCLMSMGSEEEAMQMINAVCEKGGFFLEKWISSS